MSDSFSFAGFVIQQYSSLPLIWRDLKEKVIIITGANTGLGFEAAKHLATMNASKLILAVRDVQKGEKAKEEVLKYWDRANVEVWQLDLASFDSVKSFAAKFQASGNRLDILISNAGVAVGPTWTTTGDGFETTLQVNHLSNLLLILLLIPVLRKTASEYHTEPRVVVVSSGAHAFAKYPQRNDKDPIAALNDPNRSSMNERYYCTKLLNLFMTRYLARYFPDISIHSLSPGLCRSDLSRYKKPWLATIRFAIFMFLMARTTEQGARTLVHAAVSEDLLLSRGPNGRYWDDCVENAPNKTAIDDRLAETVWKESLEILTLNHPQLKELLKDVKM
jgi:NAD(P)-dependent dehydrogenase (short-subunit alcohol dehydrogenase family)